jgi:predicted PolB exonuclease-like 3'-5' exonuclease
MILYLDIETLPCNESWVVDDLAKTITPPGQYKKQESIDEWMKENKANILKEKLAKTSFDGAYGRIACIAWAFDNGIIRTTFAGDTEKEVLEHFFHSIKEGTSYSRIHGDGEYPIKVCGHNVASFDLPFIRQRAIIHGIKPPENLLDAFKAKPWDVLDTMLLWSPDREKRISLDNLCKVLGIPGKDGFDGSMVADTWPNDPEKVISYCADDVERVRSIYRRLTWNNNPVLKEAA